MVLIAMAAVGIVAFFVGRSLRSPGQAIMDAAPPGPTTLTVPVEERQLVDVVTFRADVAVGDAHEIVISSTEDIPIVTEAPVAVGQVVEEGSPIAAINGASILLIQGDLPFYRDLEPGVTGPDVVQLQEALKRLGYEVGREGIYDELTERAAEAMFADVGVVLEQNSQGTVIEKEWLTVAPELPATVIQSALVRGLDLRTGIEPLVTVSNSLPIAVAQVDSALASILTLGTIVELDEGSVTRESRVVAVEPAGVSGDDAGLRVELEFGTSPPDHWIGLNVRATVVANRTAGPVLAVPVSAVMTDTNGQTYLRTASTTPSTRLDVEIGVVAGGYVQVTPLSGTLTTGEAVVIGGE